MANPNKTVAAARRRMGGFAPRPARDPGEFMNWVFEQAVKGRRFKSDEEARAAFDAEAAQ